MPSQALAHLVNVALPLWHLLAVLIKHHEHAVLPKDDVGDTAAFRQRTDSSAHAVNSSLRLAWPSATRMALSNIRALDFIGIPELLMLMVSSAHHLTMISPACGIARASSAV